MTTAVNKSSITEAVVYKSSGDTLVWDAVDTTWEDMTGTWDSPGQAKVAVSKNSITSSAVTKSS